MDDVVGHYTTSDLAGTGEIDASGAGPRAHGAAQPPEVAQSRADEPPRQHRERRDHHGEERSSDDRHRNRDGADAGRAAHDTMNQFRRRGSRSRSRRGLLRIAGFLSRSLRHVAFAKLSRRLLICWGVLNAAARELLRTSVLLL